jgi:hypothetical protein
LAWRDIGAVVISIEAGAGAADVTTLFLLEAVARDSSLRVTVADFFCNFGISKSHCHRHQDIEKHLLIPLSNIAQMLCCEDPRATTTRESAGRLGKRKRQFINADHYLHL